MCDLRRPGDDEQADRKTMTSCAGKPVKTSSDIDNMGKLDYMIGTYTALLEDDEFGDG